MSKINPDKSADFNIPASFLEKLGEFSNGGFVLLSITNKKRVIIHYAFDDEVSQLALTKGAENFLVRLEDAQTGLCGVEDGGEGGK